MNNTNMKYAGKKTKNNYGSRGWISVDGLFNEGQILSDARSAARNGELEETLQFYGQIAPAEVIARIRKRI